MVSTEREMRLGGWIGKQRGRGEDLQLAYPRPWVEQPVGSQGVLAGAGAGARP